MSVDAISWAKAQPVKGEELMESLRDGLGKPSYCGVCSEPIEICSHHYQVFGVCGRCAEVIANLYNKAHGGEFLTWREAAPATGTVYTKARIPSELRWQVWERDDFTCRQCGSRRDLQADHIHPERHGGETTLDNLQTLCRACNVRKGSRVGGGDK